MVHEFAFLFNFIADNAPVQTSDGFKTTIIATAGVVISAGLAAFAVIYQKHRDTTLPLPDDEDEGALVIELRHQIRQLHEAARLHSRIEREQDRELRRLQDNFWARGINPHTNREVQPGDLP